MKQGRAVFAVALTAVAMLFVFIGRNREDGSASRAAAPSSVMSVELTRAELSQLPVRVAATGTIAAWQEASIGAEAGGLKLVDVAVNVGDAVVRGQVLAQFATDVVEAELAEARAAVEQAAASAFEAETNARRARSLDGSGALSQQQILQYAVAARTAQARLEAARATERRHRLRLAQTRVRASRDGIISARTATVGAVVPAGEELFRLIADGRLEWRAAVGLADIGKLAAGQRATISLQGHAPIHGALRIVAPTIDAQTHDGLAYVDLPHHDAIRAGTFARGYFDVGSETALTVPQSAVLLRDGFHYVMHVGPASEVVVTKVSVGRRIGERVEITRGLSVSQTVIASGLGFLSEGDIVDIVGDAARPPAASATDTDALRESHS